MRQKPSDLKPYLSGGRLPPRVVCVVRIFVANGAQWKEPLCKNRSECLGLAHAVPRTASGLRYEHLRDLLLELLKRGGSSPVPTVYAQLEEGQRRTCNRRAGMRWLRTHPAHERLLEDSAEEV